VEGSSASPLLPGVDRRWIRIFFSFYGFGGSWCFARSMVVGLGGLVVFFYGLWVMLAVSSGEEFLSRIERCERRERNRFFILFDCVIYIILLSCM